MQSLILLDTSPPFLCEKSFTQFFTHLMGSHLRGHFHQGGIPFTWPARIPHPTLLPPPQRLGLPSIRRKSATQEIFIAPPSKLPPQISSAVKVSHHRLSHVLELPPKIFLCPRFSLIAPSVPPILGNWGHRVEVPMIGGGGEGRADGFGG